MSWVRKGALMMLAVVAFWATMPVSACLLGAQHAGQPDCCRGMAQGCDSPGMGAGNSCCQAQGKNPAVTPAPQYTTEHLQKLALVPRQAAVQSACGSWLRVREHGRNAATEIPARWRLRTPNLKLLPSQAEPGLCCVFARPCGLRAHSRAVHRISLEGVMKSLVAAFCVLAAIGSAGVSRAETPAGSDGLTGLAALLETPPSRVIRAGADARKKSSGLPLQRIPRLRLLPGESPSPRRMFPVAGALDDPMAMYRGWGVPLNQPWNYNEAQNMFSISQTFPGRGKRDLRSSVAESDVDVAKAILSRSAWKSEYACTRPSTTCYSPTMRCKFTISIWPLHARPLKRRESNTPTERCRNRTF